MNTESRQVRRATERRANKPAPDPIERTSTRHLGRTKGQPYSHMILKSITPSTSGVPAVFNVQSPTRKSALRTVKASPYNLEYFFKGITNDMKLSLLGMY